MEQFEDLDSYEAMMQDIIDVEGSSALALGKFLYELLRPNTVIDVGCGPGIHLLPFLARGCDGLGVDACPTGGWFIPGRFMRVDLRFAYEPPRRYELAMCMEVGEHLKPEYADTLVESVCRAGEVVFFTAAIPGQGGTCHYNEQPAAYWEALFAQRGYRRHEQMPALLAEAGRPVYDATPWLRRSSFLVTAG